MDTVEGGPRVTQSARLSFRATAKGFEKLNAVAKAKGWVNAKGEPNISAVLNYLIESFDLAALAAKNSKKEKRNGR